MQRVKLGSFFISRPSIGVVRNGFVLRVLLRSANGSEGFRNRRFKIGFVS